MSDPHVTATGEQALLNRGMQLWESHLGAPAWIALGLAVAAWLLHFQVRPAQERALTELETQRIQAEQAASATRKSRNSIPIAQPDPLAKALPLVALRGKDVGALLTTARRTHLALERADYSVEPVAGAPLTRLHADLPVVGSYSDVRKFIADVLNSMPNATLESLQLERADTVSTQLKATLRVVLFYRTAR